MKIQKFSELSKEKIDEIIDIHFNHWVKFNPKMLRENTAFKFSELYTKEELPFGIAMLDNENKLIGFCVFKIENLRKYPVFSPWLSDLMIIEKYRKRGYGKLLVNKAENILRDLGYDTLYVWTDQAQDFYKKLGFIYKQQVEKNEGGEGELYYKKLKD